jgi:mannose-6-phosphate isomerase-like protein (cupin superfamily)
VTVAPDPGQLFPAGTAVTHLAVYDWAGPDGLTGGSAHVHLACTEGYVVIGGRGRLQTLSRDGFTETALTPMTVVWFSPGVVHRLINEGGLQILVVMQNGGLPEAGDSVLTFPSSHLAEPEAYRAAAMVAGSAGPAGQAAAERRQRLAVEGFLQLRDRFEQHGPAALDEFYQSAAALVRAAVPAWRDLWAHGALAATRRTGDYLTALAAGGHDHLRHGRLTVLGPPDERSFGMCGRLVSYPSCPPDSGGNA